MMRISRKQLVIFVVASAITLSHAEIVHANPTESKSKPVDSKSKAAATVSKPVDSKGKHKHHDSEKQGGRRRGSDIPSFRSVKRLESLTAVQEAKISHIIKAQREKLLPLMERLREIREESGNAESGASERPKRNPESVALRKKVHAIKKDAWMQMQRVLTAKQKIELEAHRDDDFGPRRKHPNAQPSVHDSGRSFSK